MENFEVLNPTRIVFGKNQLGRLKELLNAEHVKKILITYGGGSIKKTGLLDQILTELESFEVIEFGESEDKTSIQDEKFELKESEDDREKIKRDRIKKIQENMKKLGF